MKNTILFLIAFLFIGGCATWTFEATRTAMFVDNFNNYATIDYGMEEEARNTVFVTDTGVRLPFKSKLKVRVTLPDGTRFVAYQNMSLQGNLYKTEDAEWEFFESGMACIVAKMADDNSGYVIKFQGTMCSNAHNPFAEKRTRVRPNSATPTGFKSPNKKSESK
ncbi:MAG: hypothetical protein J6V88_01015 [Kiritimatiellae bacterium]|nr:hypothetical protein [Kiritimatiellia bacterium]